MHLITYRETQRLAEAGIAVVLATDVVTEKDGHYNYTYQPPKSDRYVVVLETLQMLMNEGGTRVVANAPSVVYIAYLQGEIIGTFAGRTGSYYHYGDRHFANMFRKAALRRAVKALHV